MANRIRTFTLGTIVTSAPEDLWALAGFDYYSNSEEVHFAGCRLRTDIDPRKVLARVLATGLRDESAVLATVAAIDDERSGVTARRTELEAARLQNEAAQAELRAAQIQSAMQKRSLT